MAARTVAVRLTAEVGSYITGLKNASAATRDLGSQVAKEAKDNRAAWTEVGQGMLAFGAAAGVAVGLAVKSFADFDEQMSAVQAATHETADNMRLLRDAALEAGAKTAFSASEAAQGIEELAKAGVSTEAILNGGLNGALDLAAAGALGVGEAAEIAATAMTQFRLDGGKVPHVADLLSAAAGKAQGSVQDMGMALKQSGLVAAQTGLSIEETTTALAAFASAGLLGSDAGTSLKTMLQRLTPQSDEAAKLMRELGINAYDAAGQFVGLEAFAGNLQTSLANLTDEQRNSAMATIFGSDAVRAAAVLYEQGARGVAEWSDRVNDAGYAAETAATRLDNLSGDIEAFKGSLETALIGAGSGANGALRGLVQGATDVVNAFNALPGPVQQGVVVVGALASAVSLAGGAFLVAVPKVVAFKAALGEMGPATQRVGRGFTAMAGALTGPLGGALAVGAVALGIYGASRAKAKAQVEEFTEAIKADSGAIGENARALAARELEQKGALRAAERFGISLETVTQAALGDVAAMDQLRAVQAEYADIAENATLRANQQGGVLDENAIKAIDAAAAADTLVGQVDKLAAATEGGVASARRQAEALGQQAGAAQGAAEAQEGFGSAVLDANGQVIDQKEALDDLIGSFRDLSDLVLALNDAERGFEAAVDAAAEAVAKNGRTLDINTEAGRDNAEALDAIAGAANDVAEEMLNSGRPIDEVRAKIEQQRQRLYDAARQFGLTEEQARKYVDQVLRIPPARATNVTANTSQAVPALDQVQARLALLRDRNVVVTVTTRRQDLMPDGSFRISGLTGPGGVATGGYISGPGTGTSDSIPAWLSNGEYVIKAASVDKYGVEMLHAINAGKFADGGWVSGRSFGASGGGGIATANDNRISVVVRGNVTPQTIADLPHVMRDEQFRRGWY